jgi:hypothetical protein
VLAITLGAGRRNSRGRRVSLSDAVPPARALAEALARQSPGKEAWWSYHLWQGDHRKQDAWEGAIGIGVDVDYHDASGTHVALPDDVLSRVQALALVGSLPGSLYHPTPRGLRVVFAFSDLVTDRERWTSAAGEAGRGVARALGDLLAAKGKAGLEVDPTVLLDTARFVYSPRATVEGQTRDADVLVLRDEPYTLDELAPQEPEPAPAPPPRQPAPTLEDAIARYNADHAQDWPKSDGDCPACGHKRCFGRLASDDSRWVCFSASHTEPGIRATNCHHGDALDLAAHAANLKPAELLRSQGYLPAVRPVPPAKPGSTEAPPEPIHGFGKNYKTLCHILRHDPRVIGEPLEFNEMFCAPTIGGVPVDDSTVGKLREQIEILHRDSQGKCLKFSAADITMAIDQIAAEHRYHPVREYLTNLSWDHVPRLSLLAERILGLPPDELTQAMLRKWFVSAVARALSPGCKVDTVLVLHGPQGIGKSTFFSTLAGEEWFSDSPIDVQNKDALLLLRRVWILEWAELESMQRARDAAAVKAFVSSRIDSFRAPFARRVTDAPRHCVIVGTTNDDEILADPTGNRRYWIVSCPDEIDVSLLRVWRDHLWAEAVELYRRGEQHWLTPQQSHQLAHAQEQFQRRDPWEALLEDYLARRASLAPLTSGELLEKALHKPEGQLTTGDQRRVGAILRALGYVPRLESESGSRLRAWVAAG